MTSDGDYILWPQAFRIAAYCLLPPAYFLSFPLRSIRVRGQKQQESLKFLGGVCRKFGRRSKWLLDTLAKQYGSAAFRAIFIKSAHEIRKSFKLAGYYLAQPS
jgi:hypothetical protein